MIEVIEVHQIWTIIDVELDSPAPKGLIKFAFSRSRKPYYIRFIDGRRISGPDGGVDKAIYLEIKPDPRRIDISCVQ